MPTRRVPLLAVLTSADNRWVDPDSPGRPGRGRATIARCSTTSELLVLLRSGPQIDTAVLDAAVAGVDRDLIGEVLRHGCRPVVVDRTPHRRAWHELGAIMVLPHDADLTAMIDAMAGGAAPATAAAEAVAVAPFAVVIGGASTDPAAIAVALARSLALRLDPGRVALVDLTLDGCHRAAHGLSVQDRGLPELVESLRTGVVDGCPLARYGHETASGYHLVPGLRRHRDWVALGADSLQAALLSLRCSSHAVVAHTDPDVEGHEVTGSFDVEDRNVLARTAVAASDLGLITCASTAAGLGWLHQLVPELASLGLAPHRLRAVLVEERSPGTRSARTPGDPLAPVVDALLQRAPVRSTAPLPPDHPIRIEPGQLGHWTGEAPGWITPNVPQQP